MSEEFWITLILGIPAIITSIATLIAVILKMNGLTSLVNGKFTEVLDIAKSSAELKGKIEAIEKQVAPTTTVIKDRRTGEKE